MAVGSGTSGAGSVEPPRVASLYSGAIRHLERSPVVSVTVESSGARATASPPAGVTLGAIRRVYADSIQLMQISEELRRLSGVESAALVMATPANLAQLAAAGLLPADSAGARADDLLVAVRAADAASARAALD